MKKIIIKLLAFFGYQVKFKINKIPKYQIAEKEKEELQERMANYLRDHNHNVADQDGTKVNWSDLSVIKSYLNNKRIALFHRLLDELKRQGLEFDNKSILDVGSGTGYLLKVIDESYETKKLVGYDTYTELNKLSKYICPKMELYEKDLFSEFDSSYDIIFCTETLEHLKRPHLALQNMLKHLNPGGTVIITVPNGRNDNYASIGLYPNQKGYWGHINFWSIESLEVFLEENAGDKTTTVGILDRFDVLYGIIQ